ncbi:MAG: D-glutamate cyclase family protein [Bryobacteraceae bacterium]
MTDWSSASPAEFRAACRNGSYSGSSRGVCPGYLVCNLVVIRHEHAYDFLVYCQRNQKACPVLEVCDPGDPAPKRLAPGADLRTDLPLYSVYRSGSRCPDVVDIRGLWQDDFVAFLLGSGISFDQALEEAGVPTNCNRWVLRSSLPTVPSGPFRGSMIVTMRWLTPEQAIRAVQVTSRFPFNHGAPIHIGEPAVIGADIANPIFGGPVGPIGEGLMPVFWACGVTPQQAALESSIDLMITHAPGHGFVTDLEARSLAIP